MFYGDQDNLIRHELIRRIEKDGYAYETELCMFLCEKYGLTKPVVIQTLRCSYTEMSLIRRRVTDKLKTSFGDRRIGYPIVYLPEKQ